MIRHTFIAVAASTLLAGCASWFEGAGTYEPTPLGKIEQTVPLNMKWQAGVPDSGQGLFAPAYHQGVLAAAGNNGEIVLLDAITGKKNASFRLKGETLGAGVAAGDNAYFVGNDKGELIASDGQGKVLWRQKLTSVLSEPPLLAAGLVVAHTADGRLTAFDEKDGKSIWTQWQAPPSLMVRATTPVMLAVGKEVLVTGVAGGKLAVYNLQSGVPLWEATVASPRGGSELERVTDVVSQPKFDGRRVCAVAYQGRVACFDARGGNLLWAREVASSRGLAMDGRAAYVTAEDGALWAFDIETGRNLWKNDALRYRDVSGPVMLGKNILVLDGEGYAHLLASEDGRLVGRTRTGAEGTLSQPVLLGDAAYVQARNGRLVVLN
ncbi:outer membrane protein assembly factor BamB [Craterilacuibacter sp.]|uniref:outer membrane protein assembly factor BamB n=1 Tax=Craterilacuibacter sp. TaxID=2870909 RepID=UPI003F2B8751